MPGLSTLGGRGPYSSDFQMFKLRPSALPPAIAVLPREPSTPFPEWCLLKDNCFCMFSIKIVEQSFSSCSVTQVVAISRHVIQNGHNVRLTFDLLNKYKDALWYKQNRTQAVRSTVASE